MKTDEVLQRIQEIFRDVFDDKSLMIQRDTDADDIEDWDSLNHINLIVAIEKEFSIKFSLVELQLLKDVGETVDLIVKKING